MKTFTVTVEILSVERREIDIRALNAASAESAVHQMQLPDLVRDSHCVHLNDARPVVLRKLTREGPSWALITPDEEV